MRFVTPVRLKVLLATTDFYAKKAPTWGILFFFSWLPRLCWSDWSHLKQQNLRASIARFQRPLSGMKCVVPNLPIFF